MDPRRATQQRWMAPLRARMPLLLGTLVLTRPRTACALTVRVAGGMRTMAGRRSALLLRGSQMHAGAVAEAHTCSTSGAANADGLRLLNSLTNTVEPFKPIDPRLVKWYVCGPTVYDSAHVGHARNYVAFDIVRRILLDYFGYDILYVMNITDIDDKIILRTHRNHLEAMLADVASAGEALRAARETAEATLALPKPELRELTDAQRALAAAAAAASVPIRAECDVQSAFLELTAAFEAEFFEDMAALNVMPPDAITRVSDYVPEVIAYIEGIMANGYSYESNGSVYFDTDAFRDAPQKTYGKLDPSKVRHVPAPTARPCACGRAESATRPSPHWVWRRPSSPPGGASARARAHTAMPHQLATVHHAHAHAHAHAHVHMTMTMTLPQRLATRRPRAAQANAGPQQAPGAADWTEGKTSAELLAEGEGALSASTAGEKRNPNDFVLWKVRRAWGVGERGPSARPKRAHGRAPVSSLTSSSELIGELQEAH